MREGSNPPHSKSDGSVKDTLNSSNPLNSLKMKTNWQHRNRKDGAEGLDEEKQSDRSQYRDRARERRSAVDADEDKAVNILDYEHSKYLGGDVSTAHLVKGLDFQLLARIRGDASSDSSTTANVSQDVEKLQPLSRNTQTEIKKSVPLFTASSLLKKEMVKSTSLVDDHTFDDVLKDTTVVEDVSKNDHSVKQEVKSVELEGASASIERSGPMTVNRKSLNPILKPVSFDDDDDDDDGAIFGNVKAYNPLEEEEESLPLPSEMDKKPIRKSRWDSNALPTETAMVEVAIPQEKVPGSDVPEFLRIDPSEAALAKEWDLVNDDPTISELKRQKEEEEEKKLLVTGREVKAHLSSLKSFDPLIDIDDEVEPASSLHNMVVSEPVKDLYDFTASDPLNSLRSGDFSTLGGESVRSRGGPRELDKRVREFGKKGDNERWKRSKMNSDFSKVQDIMKKKFSN